MSYVPSWFSLFGFFWFLLIMGQQRNGPAERPTTKPAIDFENALRHIVEQPVMLEDGEGDELGRLLQFSFFQDDAVSVSSLIKWHQRQVGLAPRLEQDAGKITRGHKLTDLVHRNTPPLIAVLHLKAPTLDGDVPLLDPGAGAGYTPATKFSRSFSLCFQPPPAVRCGGVEARQPCGDGRLLDDRLLVVGEGRV